MSEPRAETALRLAEIAVPFGDEPGLERISLEVRAGERLVLVGASGAGKTTLLRAIAGFVPVACGTIEVRGRDCTPLPPERRDVVYLHQTPLLFPHLDVFENVAFPLRVRRVPAAEIERRVPRMLDAVRMSGHARRRPRDLSGGERHRVALARAIAAMPAVLLLDEPLSSLDPTLRDEVRAAILALQAEHSAALVLVTHDLDEAGLLADRIGVLLARTVAQIATPEELFGSPASLAVARFLGFENEVPGVVADGGKFVTALGMLHTHHDPFPTGPAVAVFRPDALRVDVGGGIQGTVRALLRRPHRTTARVAVGDLELEASVESLAPPVPGASVRLSLDARRVRLVPAAPL